MKGAITATFSVECGTCPRTTAVEEETMVKARRKFIGRGWKHKVLHLGWQCPDCLRHDVAARVGR